MIFPITFWTNDDKPNGRNWPFFVKVNKNHPHRAAVWAQEAYESRYKMNPINLIRSLTRKGKRELEIMGHEIEAQAAHEFYGVNASEYRNKEAIVMAYGYDGLFEGMSASQIAEKMRMQQFAAASWVADHAKYIEERM